MILDPSQLMSTTKCYERLLIEKNSEIDQLPDEIWKQQTLRSRLKKDKAGILKKLAELYTEINSFEIRD